MDAHLMNRSERDVNVVPPDMLDAAEVAAFGSNVALLQYPNGETISFRNEEDACAAQRHYRMMNGLHPMTGANVTGRDDA